MGPDLKVVCLAVCRIHGESTIENLNPKYAMMFTRDVCAGDPRAASEFAGALLHPRGGAMRLMMEFGKPMWAPQNSSQCGVDVAGIC